MSRRRSLQARIDDYLAERRRQGFRLRSGDAFLSRFARFVAAKRHRGPLTAELMAEWVRTAKDGNGDAGTWARSWGRLRHFICYLQQFEPDVKGNPIFPTHGNRKFPTPFKPRPLADGRGRLSTSLSAGTSCHECSA